MDPLFQDLFNRAFDEVLRKSNEEITEERLLRMRRLLHIPEEELIIPVRVVLMDRWTLQAYEEAMSVEPDYDDRVGAICGPVPCGMPIQVSGGIDGIFVITDLGILDFDTWARIVEEEIVVIDTNVRGSQ